MASFISLFAAALALGAAAAHAQQADGPAQIDKSIGKLRSLPDADRAVETKRLALAIRGLANGPNRFNLAFGLANLATEGDFGRDTLQEVTTTLAECVSSAPANTNKDALDFAYLELAELAAYEGMNVPLESDAYTAARAKVRELNRERAAADFTLTDIDGRTWQRSALKGKVVVVNFWATWCPPCHKEIPDIQALYDKFKGQGLVVLAISDETIDKVRPFVQKQSMTYPVLLDNGRKINELYHVDGIPKSFVYDRNGNLVAQAMDMRTRGQFLRMLAAAGLH